MKTVVIVDDKALMRKALCRLFKTAGDFEVCGEAASGREAIEVARQVRPDLIVLDLCMPEMNGLETARKLRALQLPCRMILYSLHADDMAPKEAVSAGVAAVVSKAEGVTSLISKARNVLAA